MFLELANHNGDLKDLLEKGYAITEDHGYLVVRDIPYLDNQARCQTGAIVTSICDVDGKKVKPHDHQIFFAGSHPCEMDGTPIRGLGGGPTNLALPSSPDVVVQRSFSNKLMTANGSLRDYQNLPRDRPQQQRLMAAEVEEAIHTIPRLLAAAAGEEDLHISQRRVSLRRRLLPRGSTPAMGLSRLLPSRPSQTSINIS